MIDPDEPASLGDKPPSRLTSERQTRLADGDCYLFGFFIIRAVGAFTDDEVKHSQGRMGGLPGGSQAGFVSSPMLVCVATNPVWLGFGIS
jgi:hypothetical protein